MPKRLPLTLDDCGRTQQLQRNDHLDTGATGTVSRPEFEELRNQFRLLLVALHDEGFRLPDELLKEMEQLC